jgi:hypothetical protein
MRSFVCFAFVPLETQGPDNERDHTGYRGEQHDPVQGHASPLRSPRRDACSALRTVSGQLPGLQGLSTRKPRGFEDLLLVKGLPLHQGFSERVEFPAVCAQESLSLHVALPKDSEHLGINGLGGLLAE